MKIKVEDSHSGDKLTCAVTCEGLAFHELGKQGYKIELSSEVFEARTSDYVGAYDNASHTWYDNFYKEHKEKPEATLDYWVNDIGIGHYDWQY